MVASVTFDEVTARVRVGDWSARATWVRRSPDALDPDARSALVGIRRGVSLLIKGHPGDTVVHVEAWAGVPEESDGVAVLVDCSGSLVGTAPIALHGCGDRGCGNSNVQLYNTVCADYLPELVKLLRRLDDVDQLPTYGRTWMAG